ncbi:hypothetical protein Adt_30554 [Abeliophyllum distichum]|uniref:Uncharacterized protein n=1 Tax=Abeliophyllum distichum TaxID=126358 RepID=A0ABD1RDC1_9LAMI
MRDQEVNMEMETREIPEFQTRVQTNIETQIEISHPDIETKGATNGEPVMEKDGKRNEVVTKTSEQLNVESEKITNEQPAMKNDGVADRMVTGGQQPVGETEQLLMEFAMDSQRPKVETQRVTERVVRTDVPAVFFTRKKRKNNEMVKSKELASKRLRVPSGHLSSPLTATINRRKFIDGSKD